MTRIALFLLAVLGPSAAHAAPLNVVVLVSDDQRADTIGALGNAHIRTPHLDRLAGRGMAFTNAFCMGSTIPAVCAPSRAMYLTGRSLYRATLPGQDPQKALPELPMWPETFRSSGYTTCGIGKWHNPPAAYARSFSTGGPVFFGGMNDQFRMPVQDFAPDGKYSAGRRRIADKHSSELFADAAVEFLGSEQAKAAPFLLYVAFTAPHDPRQAPEEYVRLYDPAALPLPANFLPEHPFDNGEMNVRDEKLLPRPRDPQKVREDLALYYAMITHLDAQIGRILAALDASGQAANTLIIFTSDHGLALGSHGLLGKQNLYDHSMRAPLILAGPGVPRGARSAAQCYLFDLFPTACEMAGVPAPQPMEGRSLAPLFQKPDGEFRGTIFGAYRDVQRSVRTPDWKLIRYPGIGREQLFHLRHDPDERHDLAADPSHSGKLAELRDALTAAQRENSDPLLSRAPKPSLP
jgi:arylsulfatase A-like enzyme